MTRIKSTTIVPIGIYCFVLGVYFLSLALNAILSNKAVFSGKDLGTWLPAAVYTLLAVGVIIIGIGFIRVINLCWKILFFSLSICVSSIAALVIASLVFLMLGTNVLYLYLKSNQINLVEWFSFLSFFLSEIIVLYYMSLEEVVTSFGGMGELISPF